MRWTSLIQEIHLLAQGQEQERTTRWLLLDLEQELRHATRWQLLGSKAGGVVAGAAANSAGA